VADVEYRLPGDLHCAALADTPAAIVRPGAGRQASGIGCPLHKEVHPSGEPNDWPPSVAEDVASTDDLDADLWNQMASADTMEEFDEISYDLPADPAPATRIRSKLVCRNATDLHLCCAGLYFMRSASLSKNAASIAAAPWRDNSWPPKRYTS
jgi:hypothetical protein